MMQCGLLVFETDKALSLKFANCSAQRMLDPHSKSEQPQMADSFGTPSISSRVSSSGEKQKSGLDSNIPN